MLSYDDIEVISIVMGEMFWDLSLAVLMFFIIMKGLCLSILHTYVHICIDMWLSIIYR